MNMSETVRERSVMFKHKLSRMSKQCQNLKNMIGAYHAELSYCKSFVLTSIEKLYHIVESNILILNGKYTRNIATLTTKLTQTHHTPTIPTSIKNLNISTPQFSLCINRFYLLKPVCMCFDY